MAESEGKMPSPRRYRDREIYSDSKERQEVQRREGKRDTKSEGDGDERELRRERVRDKEREELMYKHSRSEGDNKGKRAKERDQDGQGHREDKQRNRGREIEVDRSRKRGVEKERGRYREADRRAAREADRGEETWKESREDLKDDRSEDDKYKEYKQRRDREIKEREADPRWDNTTGRSSRFLNETAPRVPRQTLSSGEWSSDIDTEMRHRSRHSYEERESGREGATADERDVEQRDPERTAERSQRAQKRSERQERDTGETTGSLSAQRRMWLEPQRGKNSKEEFVNREIHTRGKERKREEETGIESQGQWEREGRRVKEEPNETYSDQSSYRGKHGGRNEYRRDVEEKTEGVSVDGEEVGEVWRETDNGGKEQLSDNDEGIEGSQQRDAEGENVTDNIEDGDREEEGGTGYLARFESEGGSETGWKHDKDRMLSGEDDFLTLSSGGDEDDEDEKFEDCQEFWEGGLAYDDASPVGFSGCEGGKEWDKDLTTEKEETVDKEEAGREKQPKYVFCVIGQTLPRSHHDDMSPSQADEMGSVERDNSISERCHHYSDDTAQQSQDDMHPSLFRNDEYPAINNRETELQDTETREGLRSQVELPCAEILQIRRESQTEKLLIEWREKNKELADAERKQPSPVPSSAHICSEVNFEQIQSIVDGLNSGAISPEEIEAIRIQMSTAWSLSDEPKRHSQAPHLKWAKNVVCKILGHSQEQTVNKPNSQLQGDQGVNETETAIKNGKEQEVLAQGTKEIPVVKLTTNEHAESELEEDVPLEVEGLRGMGQSQGDMHADQFTTMHGDTPTHTLAETQLDREGVEDNSMEREIEPSGHLQLEKADREMKITQEGGDGEVMVSEIEKEEHRETEMELCLPESNMLYKHNSCPILNYESDSDLPVPFSESKKQEVEDGMGESEEEMPEKEPEEMGTTEEVGKMRGVEEAVEVEGRGEVMAEGKIEGGTQMIDSFQDLGPEARMRRRGIRKTTERRNGELFEVKEEEGVARDRRTRIFSLTDDEDDSSRSLGGVELRNVLDTLQRHKRKSKFFNATQLYQQYNEAAQNFEILSQSRSDVLHVREGGTSSPAPSPPPARRPLPALPPVLHPHSFFQTGSITSIQSLPLPEPPKSEGRSPSPRLSISLTQSATLWRDLPGVRNSHELEELTEDQMRLQEVRFEVVTSEASYRRSLDIVVEHFVKSKQLGALLTTKDRNWLFSRLTDVRAVSHSFLSKLEERVESDILQFTVCDVIAQHCQRFKMVYVPYLTNQSYQDATFQRLMNENPRFRRIVEKLEASPVCQRLPLRSFLVLPFQRITRLKLLVQNIVKRTTPGTAEATQAIKALKLLEKLIQESNDSISQMKNIESLVTLSARVDFECRTLPLISQSRRLVKEGPVTELMDFSLKETERSVYLHLFNDYLLLSLQKEGGRFIVIDHSPVVDVHVENCRAKRLTSQKNLFRLRVAQKSLLLWTDTESDKLRWISALSRPHPEIDFSAAQDYPQMQCIRAFTAQQPDELSLEKADIILVHKQSSDHWVEGTRLTDRHRGWVPESHLETISSSRVKQRNLSDALKLTTATAAV